MLNLSFLNRSESNVEEKLTINLPVSMQIFLFAFVVTQVE